MQQLLRFSVPSTGQASDTDRGAADDDESTSLICSTVYSIFFSVFSCCPRCDAVAEPPAAREFSCLDRPFVQQEIQWARKYNKKFIVLCEMDDDQGKFDFQSARLKYKDTEWEFILDMSAIHYHRDDDHANTMIQKVLRLAPDSATGRSAVSTVSVTTITAPRSPSANT